MSIYPRKSFPSSIILYSRKILLNCMCVNKNLNAISKIIWPHCVIIRVISLSLGRNVKFRWQQWWNSKLHNFHSGVYEKKNVLYFQCLALPTTYFQSMRSCEQTHEPVIFLSVLSFHQIKQLNHAFVSICKILIAQKC